MSIDTQVMTSDQLSSDGEIRQLSDSELDNVNGAILGAIFGAIASYVISHPKESYGAAKWVWNKITSWF